MTMVTDTGIKQSWRKGGLQLRVQGKYPIPASVQDAGIFLAGVILSPYNRGGGGE